MSEATSNVEFALKIHEDGHHQPSPANRREQWVEIIEAVVLATVAVATAWSGYQAAKWDALSNQHYSLASTTMVVSQEKATLAGQDRLYDITTFNGWVAAKVSGKEKLAAFYQRRFRLNNPTAPPGPIFVPEYTNANMQAAAKLAEQANGYFERGVSTRENGDRYVKVTVFLATVLLLTALSQRFEIFGPRVVVVTVALVLLVMSAYWILTFPRA